MFHGFTLSHTERASEVGYDRRTDENPCDYTPRPPRIMMSERAPDLVIRKGTLVTPVGAIECDVAVRDGRIVEIVRPGEGPSAVAEIDAAGLHVLPGIIDTHVHTRDPGVPEREDFWSGTCAAAAGGITTLLEMPISKLPVNSAAALRRRAAMIQPRALIDFALYGGAGDENIDAIAEQADAGAVAFKTFLHPPPPARRDEFAGLSSTSPSTLREVMRATSRTGVPHAFHCEHAPTIEALQARLEASDRLTGLAHAESRPPIVEDLSVATILALAAEAGGPVHVVHVSSPRAAALVQSARQRGLEVTAETCPQYLFLTSEALNEHGPFAKCNPALRSRPDVDALWRFVLNGTIDVIGSDHSPFLESEKANGRANIFLAPPGLTGLETMLPLMLTAVAERRLTLTSLVRLMSQRAADLFGLPGKGGLSPGCDADLTLVDLASQWTFDRTRSFSRSPESMRVYDGWHFQGRVVSTVVRGLLVYREGEVTGQPGHGQFVRRRERREHSS